MTEDQINQLIRGITIRITSIQSVYEPHVPEALLAISTAAQSLIKLEELKARIIAAEQYRNRTITPTPTNGALVRYANTGGVKY